MRQAETKMLDAIGRDRQERFGTVPDSGLRLNVAGTFEDRERAGEWLECYNAVHRRPAKQPLS